jgi:CheY-like chemotaxis protein
MNLMVNARDAMPTGGTITLETAEVRIGAGDAHLDGVVPAGDYVMLGVTDTGVGMSREVQSRIFEPFFTTKERGRGTGLGLATVYGIVKQNNGYVAVASEPGHGATFRVFLPRVAGAVAAKGASAATGAASEGSETILVVEDEQAVRGFLREALEAYGYRVLEATDFDGAIDAVTRRHHGDLHLLLTDVILPGKSGAEVARAVRALRPETKVLFVSGHTDDAVVRYGVRDSSFPFLQKPFTLAALAGKVREVLSGEEAATERMPL